MKGCKKKRHLSLSVVTACLAFLEVWNHPFLSLQTENQNISPTCLLPSSALPHTAMFLSPALCPQSYLTLCHTLKKLENSWDALRSTLIFQNLHAPFWPKKTLQNLHHFATQLNSNIEDHHTSASAQSLRGWTVHMGLCPNLHLKLGQDSTSDCMCATWKPSHLLTLLWNVLLFPPLNKPSSLTGKLLAKWVLPGQGTTCCPLGFKNLKVSQYSEATLAYF